MLRTEDTVIAPLHIRHHWVLAIFSTLNNHLRARVYDSAPSPVTRRDINGTLCRLHAAVDFVRVPKQPRGSCECGVHVILHAWRHFFDLGELTSANEFMPLGKIRARIQELAEAPATSDTAGRAKEVALVEHPTFL